MANKRGFISGFTLIELLVVVAIISLLASVVLAALDSARTKAQNARRMEDIESIRNAIELYATDNAGSYPTAGAAECLGVSTGNQCWTGYHYNAGGSGINGNSTFNSLLVPSYISSLPADPAAPRTLGDTYVYFQGSADIHCNGVDSVHSGNWLAWEPGSTVNPGSDSLCSPGYFACCSGIGCGSNNFCVMQM